MLFLLKCNGVEMFFFPGRLFPCPVKLIGEPKVSDRKNAHLGRTLSADLPLLWAMYTNKKILSSNSYCRQEWVDKTEGLVQVVYVPPIL